MKTKPDDKSSETPLDYKQKIFNVIKKMPKYITRNFPYIFISINPAHAKADEELCKIVEQEILSQTEPLQTRISQLEHIEERLISTANKLSKKNQDYETRLENIANQIPQDLKTPNQQ